MSNDPFSLDDYVPPAHEPMTHAPAAYMEGLNKEQKQAVECLDGPLLVLAGAGTGKTRVLTTRLTHLLATGKAAPHQILALTFTNKAAQEMQERVAQMIRRPIGNMAVGTFHSVAARLLRKHCELVGLKSNFSILDSDDQIRLLKQIIKEQNIDDKKWPAKHMAGLIDQWKNKALTPDKITADQSFHFAEGQGKKIYGLYQNRLRTLNATDFGDLLLHLVNILQKHHDILAQYHARFRYIMVDEYQDTNTVQYLWLRLLAQAHKNICCVGDDDQSIYGWRGAEIGNILRFERDFEGAKTIRLEQNYRSTGHILAAASGLINSNTGRLGKTLWTAEGDGEKITIHGVWDGREEARTVSDEVERLQKLGLPLNQMAVLVRAGFQTREFEDRFLSLALPYRVVGGPRFYERREVRDAIAYLRLINQPHDDLAFERIVNLPKRGFGDASVQILHKLARAHDISLMSAAKQALDINHLKPAQTKTLTALLAQFDTWREQALTLKLDELMDEILKSSGLIKMWKDDKSIEAKGRLENLEELVRAMGSYENLEAFLEHIALVMENNQNTGQALISIMTLHGAKGLEFNVVFLPGWEETVFPIQRSLDEGGLEGLEEERRLAYVGLTRARKKAHILYAGSRMVFGQWQTLLPSRFIAELPEENIERTGGLNMAATKYDNDEGFEHKNYAYEKPQAQWSKSYSRYEKPEPTRNERIQKARKSTVKRAKNTRVVSEYAIGEQVVHVKFGLGTIEDIEGDILEVNFETVGTKRLIDSYVARP